MGDRRAGADNVHTDRDQVEAIRSVTPEGDQLEILPPELDVSGGLPLEKRPSLRVAVEGVEAGRYAGIIVAYQSRLFRNVEEEEAVWRRVEAAGGEVLLALDGVDTKTVSGRMVRRIKSAINAAEREEHAERFERLREFSTAAGIWQRRQTPRGYRKDPETRRLVADENADSVRSAFADAAAGRAIVDIARELGMTTSGVRQLLRNRVYLGELRVGRHVNPAAHDPIVDAETFERVQHRLDAGVRPSRTGGAPALLAGLARCASCGHLMTRGNSSGAATYACPKYHSGEQCPAAAGIMCARLDAYIEPIAVAELDRLRVERAEGGRITRAQAKLSGAERELETYLAAVSAAEIGAEAFAAGARTRQEAIDAARDELRAEMARHPSLPLSGTGAEIWESLGAHERNVLLRGLLAAVVVRPAGRGRTLPVDERVRVVAHGSELPVLRPRGGGGRAHGIIPIPFDRIDDRDGVRVLRVSAVQEAA